MRDPNKLNVSLASDGSPHNNRVMTITEIAEYQRVHPSTVYRLLKQRAIPGFRVGRDWRFDRESIDEWRLKSTVQEDAVGKRPKDQP